MTLQQNLELFIAYRSNPSIALRNKIVEVNIGLVRKIAHAVASNCREPYEDLEQLGYLGLIRAIERFNPQQGYAFSSFAVPYVRGEMLHFLRDKAAIVKLPRKMQELWRESQRLLPQLTQELGNAPTDEQMAAELGISTYEWQQIKIGVRAPRSLDSKVGKESEVLLSETLTDTRIKRQVCHDDRSELQWALGQLDDKTRASIEFVFFNDRSRKDVAEQIGVSPMTVSRRIQKGINEIVELIGS